jgi:hypothetical protein
MTPQRHLISDISFAAGWVTCTCGKKLHVSTKGREVDGGTESNRRLAEAYALHQRQVRGGPA